MGTAEIARDWPAIKAHDEGLGGSKFKECNAEGGPITSNLINKLINQLRRAADAHQPALSFVHME